MTDPVFAEEFELISDEDANKHQDTYPFAVRVLVCKDITPRDPRVEMVLDMGRGFTERVFDPREQLFKREFAVFPERFMSCIEQQSTMEIIKRKAAESGLTDLRIVTSSPLLVSAFHKEYIRILSHPKDDPRSMYHKDYLRALFVEGKDVA